MNIYRAALAYLQLGPIETNPQTSEFICHAIEQAAIQHNYSIDVEEAACNYVHTQLGQYPTVEGWVYANIPGFEQAMGAEWWRNARSVPHLFAQLQQYRYRWLTHLADQVDQGAIKL